MRTGRILSGAIVALTCAVVAGCGGGGGESTTATTASTATSPQQLARRLTAYTGVRAEAAMRSFIPDEVRFEDVLGQERFGGARVIWAEDRADRAGALDASKPEQDGWYASSDGDVLAMPFGDHVVLRGYDFDHGARRPADLLAAQRAVRAAYSGRPELLPAAERSCELQHLSPLHGATGACALQGVPTTFVAAPDALKTDVIEARVTGMQLTGVVGEGSITPERAAPGHRYVVVAFRLHNPTRERLIPTDARLRIADQSFEIDRRATLDAGPYGGEVAPGADDDRVAVFQVPAAVAERARADGALVLPTDLRTHGLLDDRTSQGWIRLAKAPATLPKQASPSPSPSAPAPQQQAPGPPNIPVKEGNGVAFGAAARGAYYASAFFPIPGNYQPGPVHAGTVAGQCQVPAPTDEDRRQIADMARAAYPKDDLHGIYDKSLLLADCGSMGDFGIVFWGHDRNGHDIISGVEIVRRNGRWVENKGKFYPGCTIPLDAAAAWQIDVSPCPKEAPRPHPQGQLS